MPIQIHSITDTSTGTAFYWKGVDWAPGQGTVAEILQNVYVVLSTPIGSQVLNRAFGVWTRYIDKPQNIALPLVRWLFTVAIQAWENRFRVSKVDFSATSEADALNGVVQCAVTGSIDVGAINPYRGLLLSAQQAPSKTIVTPAGQIINVPL